MNYQQSKAIFDAMDDLETYSKMYIREWSREECDFTALTRYQGGVDTAKCKIFNLAKELKNDLRS